MSAVRSRIMAAIRGKDTKPELLVRSALHRAGLRFRLHRRDLPGKPDLVLARYRTVVMVHGCFWHHHGCAKSGWPKTRAEFWRKKLLANVQRDQRTKVFLRAAGWKQIVVWECEITPQALAKLAHRIRQGEARAKR